MINLIVSQKVFFIFFTGDDHTRNLHGRVNWHLYLFNGNLLSPVFMAQFKAKYYTMTGGKQKGQKSCKIKYKKHHQTYV